MNKRSKKKRIQVIFANSYPDPDSVHWTIPLLESEHALLATNKNHPHRTLRIANLFADGEVPLPTFHPPRCPALLSVDLEAGARPDYRRMSLLLLDSHRPAPGFLEPDNYS